MNVVDSCGWIEFLTDGPDAAAYEEPLRDLPNLVVPTICLVEVFRKVLRERGEDAALTVAAAMRRGRVLELDGDLALAAARLGHAHRLPLADSVVYATAREHDAVVWTHDDHFRDLPGVRFLGKRATPAAKR